MSIYMNSYFIVLHNVSSLLVHLDSKHCSVILYTVRSVSFNSEDDTSNLHLSI